MTALKLSPLPHTWFIDIDGTTLKHNGFLDKEAFLPGVHEFWARIPAQDKIILLTARKESQREATVRIFAEAGLRFDQAVFDLPPGERILINDTKPSGLATALAINVVRDEGLSQVTFDIDPKL